MSARAIEPPMRARIVAAPDRWRLLPLLLLSIALHVALALVLASVLSRHLAQEPEAPLELGIDVTLGEAVQELIVAPSEPAPPEPLTPPAPPVPEPEPAPPPEPPPMPKETPEFMERKLEPKPESKAPPKPPKRVAPKAPLAAKAGPVPREGVIGGNVTQGALAGTPGGEKIGNQGWRAPKPSYPPSALAARIQGSGEMRISTDATGRVREVVMTRSISPILDENTRSFVRSNWKGPPNTTRIVPVIYQIP